MEPVTRPGHEQTDREQAEPERRHRDPDVRQPGEHVVADRVLLHRRVHAERDGERSPRRACPRTAAAAWATARADHVADTSSWVASLLPKSPRTKSPSQSTTARRSGRSSPSASLLVATRGRVSRRRGTWRADRTSTRTHQNSEERRDEQHRDRVQDPAQDVRQHRRLTSRCGSAGSSRRRPASHRPFGGYCLTPHSIDVPEHALDRVVADRTDDLLAPDQDVGQRVERQRDVVVGQDRRPACRRRLRALSSRLVSTIAAACRPPGCSCALQLLPGVVVRGRRDVLRAQDRAQAGRRATSGSARRSPAW